MGNLKNEIARLKKIVGQASPQDVVFMINGEDEAEEFVLVDGQKMAYEDFLAKYPGYKPESFEIEMGEWHEP
ncbi:hypothetical protein [Enterococcus xiangfangensis]|uniref:Phage protein n=1 Tax=Enterococcus xiangfangensis TaxID=1296537 RepID=A0ABU3FDM6_9ENTE|nr:hypothetical protein [Enterococcus xiangfangensis]MDT2760788.1 hypothetical protein [Enterococcus xiangfangensis]